MRKREKRGEKARRNEKKRGKKIKREKKREEEKKRSKRKEREKGKKRNKEKKKPRVNYYQSAFNSQKEKPNISAEMLKISKSLRCCWGPIYYNRTLSL